jgi:hypothetical protein
LDEELGADDSDFWTLVVLAPAFFYHEGWDKSPRKEFFDLIAPIGGILPTLSATLLMIVQQMVEYWTEISDYVDTLIARQDLFLHGDQHDQLLFDDDNLTRSCQYFWVISSVGRFISILEETIYHYDECSSIVFLGATAEGKHRKALERLQDVKQRFGRQRSRATERRDAVSPWRFIFIIPP